MKPIRWLVRSKNFCAVLIVLAIIAVIAPMALEARQITPPSQGGVPPGQPFQNLQKQIDDLKALINNNLISDHHTEMKFTLDSGLSKTITLPKKQSPIRIEVTVNKMDGPTEIMYAVVNQDSQTSEMTWIGTNSDGTVVATNSLASTDDVIAFICGDSTCSTLDASLLVDSLANSTVKIHNDASSTSSFVVHLWF